MDRTCVPFLLSFSEHQGVCMYLTAFWYGVHGTNSRVHICRYCIHITYLLLVPEGSRTKHCHEKPGFSGTPAIPFVMSVPTMTSPSPQRDILLIPNTPLPCIIEVVDGGSMHVDSLKSFRGPAGP